MKLRAIIYTSFVVYTGLVAHAEDLRFKDKFIAAMPERVRQILRLYDPATGHFSSTVWECRAQNLMYPLAVAYATPGQSRYKDASLLPVIMKAGDALIDTMDEEAAWEYRKSDGSTWGAIRSPWVYARWIMTFDLIRDDMPPERREAWQKALTHGFTVIAAKDLKELHNIPTFKAMALYQAGITLKRPEWCSQASEYLMKIVGAQAEGGYWKEGGGPLVVEYNSVYVEALGHYYAMSHDRRVLPALERAAAYHAHCTYPDGRCVETLDQRNPYSADIPLGNVGFSYSSVGRSLSHCAVRRRRATATLGLASSTMTRPSSTATPRPSPTSPRPPARSSSSPATSTTPTVTRPASKS